MFNRLLIVGAVGALLVAAPQGNAQNRNEISTFTTTDSIEVAGVILPPGTYVIRVVDQASGETYNRNVIQITSEDLKQVYVTAAANPRPAKTDSGSEIPLFEYYVAAGEAKVLKTWYPAGTKTGRDIVYPRKRAMELARMSRETIPSIPDDTRETELKTVPLTPIVAERVAEPKPEPKPAAMIAEAAPEMPRTASHVPMYAGLGLLSLGGALALRQAARRMA